MTVLQKGDCFTRRGSLLSVTSAVLSAEGDIRSFSVGRMGTDLCPENRQGLDLFSFCFPEAGDGLAVRCEPEMMRLVQGASTVAELCFPEPDVLRIRCRGPLRFTGPLKEHEALIDRLDGTFQLGFFDSLGEMLFWPLRGQGRLQCAWDWTRAGTGCIDLLFAPDEEGVAEVCVRYGDANVEKVNHLPSFETCVENVRADYLRWCDGFALPAEELREKHDAAVWHVWNCMVAGQGRLKAEVPAAAIRSAVDVDGAVLCAAALVQQPSAAAGLLRGVLSYQSASGCLPSRLDDINADFLGTPLLSANAALPLPTPKGEDRALLTWLAALGEVVADRVRRWIAAGGLAAYPAAPLRQNLPLKDSVCFLLAERLNNQAFSAAPEGGELSE